MKIKLRYRFVDWVCRTFVGYNYLDQLYVRIKQTKNKIENAEDGSMVAVEPDVLENIDLI